MWGARDADEDWHDPVPKGFKLKASQREARRAFGLNNGGDGNLFQGLEKDAVDFGEVAKVYADRMLDREVGSSSGGGGSSSIKIKQAKRGATNVAQNMHGMHRAAMGKGVWGKGGEVLSPINQPEMGVNSGMPCPNYGLDLSSYLVSGATGHMWRRTVTISSQDGEVWFLSRPAHPFLPKSIMVARANLSDRSNQFANRRKASLGAPQRRKPCYPPPSHS